MIRRNKFAILDLFAGCGGLSLGMEQAGFTPVFANERWELAATTYCMNRDLTEEQMFVGDIYYLVDFTFSETVVTVIAKPRE